MLAPCLCSTLTAAAIFFGLLIGSASAQTKITIGVAAMSPRTIPLLLAQEQGLYRQARSRRAHRLDQRCADFGR